MRDCVDWLDLDVKTWLKLIDVVSLSGFKTDEIA